MELDLETFLTVLYVMTDEMYVKYLLPRMPRAGGPTPKLSDSEVLCLGLAAQWRSGVPWQTERSFVRYALAHLRPFFPGMTSQSAFNRRLRRLWGAFIWLQQALAEQLHSTALCEVMDCVPVPIARGARSFHPGWLADIARRGKGGNDRYFYGLHLLLTVTDAGIATGWNLAAGDIQDRWLAELLLSARAGCPQLRGPRSRKHHPRPQPPSGWLGPVQSCGQRHPWPILADLGYASPDWFAHWAHAYGSDVLTPLELERHAARRWHAGLRQVVETAFSHLCESFGLKFPGAHTTWGLLTRTAAKLAAYNLGIQLNRYCGRPDFAFATLIV
jgi:hypothetical protein